MIVAASQVAVSLGYIPPPCSSSISYSLAPQSNISDHPGLDFSPRLNCMPLGIPCSCCCCLRESRL
jgi:hypothetical protein